MAERHLGSKGTVPEGSSVDLDDIIAKNPCHLLYMALEDCLVETNRNWKGCQVQVRMTLFLLSFYFILRTHQTNEYVIIRSSN